MPDQYNSSFISGRKKTLDDLAAQAGELRNPPSLRDADAATKADVLLSNLPGPMGPRPGGGMASLLAAGVLPVGTRLFHASRAGFKGFKPGYQPESRYTFFGSTPGAAELGAGPVPAAMRTYLRGRTTQNLNIHTLGESNPKLLEALQSDQVAKYVTGYADPAGPNQRSMHQAYQDFVQQRARIPGAELHWSYGQHPAFIEALRQAGFHGSLFRDEAGISLGILPEHIPQAVQGQTFRRTAKPRGDWRQDTRFQNLLKAAGY